MSREKKPRKQTAKPAKKTSKQALTPKQEKFVQAYIETGNASEAYRQAYDVSPTIKPNTVEKRACELLKNGKVAGRVAELQTAQQKRFEITQDRWLAEYVALGFSDMSTVTEWDRKGVKVKSSADLPQHVKAAVQSIEQTPNGLKIKLHDKKGALDAIGKHFGWFEKDNRQAGQAAGEAIATATDELISRIARLAARAAEDRGTEGNKRG